LNGLLRPLGRAVRIAAAFSANRVAIAFLPIAAGMTPLLAAAQTSAHTGINLTGYREYK
jgi:hypothetical protein